MDAVYLSLSIVCVCKLSVPTIKALVTNSEMMKLVPSSDMMAPPLEKTCPLDYLSLSQ